MSLHISTASRLNTVEEYYFSTKLKQIAQFKAEGIPVINIGIGSPDLAPSQKTIDALTAAAANPDHHAYQGYQGIPALRKAFADFYATHYQVKLNSASEVLPLMGSKEGIMHISMAFLNQGDEVLIPNPGYPTYNAVTQLLQAKSIFYDLDETSNWLPDLDLIEKKDLTRVKLMWILCIITFFFSAVLDNLTTSIVMAALISKLIKDKNIIHIELTNHAYIRAFIKVVGFQHI